MRLATVAHAPQKAAFTLTRNGRSGVSGVLSRLIRRLTSRKVGTMPVPEFMKTVKVGRWHTSRLITRH